MVLVVGSVVFSGPSVVGRSRVVGVLFSVVGMSRVGKSVR